MEIVEHTGEPRIEDTVLAARLGFSFPQMIKRLIERHDLQLRAFGEIKVTATKNEDPLGRGRPGKTYMLNRKQALYICAKSETPRAAEVTIEMVEVFDAWLEGKTVKVRQHWRRPPQPAAVEETAQEIAPRLPRGHFSIVPLEGDMRQFTATGTDHLVFSLAARWAEIELPAA